MSLDELRGIAAFAAEAAQHVLYLFEQSNPDDPRAREAIDAAKAFAGGGDRGKRLRDSAWAALRAAGEVATPAAEHAARAAMAAASSAYLHPLAQATQVKHVLGAAAHAARAVELAADESPGPAADFLAKARARATPNVIDVLRRYPTAPPGGGRIGELLRELDRMLREG